VRAIATTLILALVPACKGTVNDPAETDGGDRDANAGQSDAGGPAPDAGPPPACEAAGAATVTLDIQSASASDIAPDALGGMFETWGTALRPDDPGLVEHTAELALGNIRYPGGSGSNYYDWKTGTLRHAWRNLIGFYATNVCDTGYSMFEQWRQTIAGKGAVTHAAMRGLTAALRASTIYVYSLRSGMASGRTLDTDVPAMMDAVRGAGHDVRLWELNNEPWLVRIPSGSSFIPWTGGAYAHDALIAARAVHAKDPGATVGVSWGVPDNDGYTGGGAGTFKAWSNDLRNAVNAASSDWGAFAIAVHLYAGTSAATMDQYRLDLLWSAANDSDLRADWISNGFTSHPDIFFTEVGSMNNNKTYAPDDTPNPTCANCNYRNTLLAGLYDVEFTARALRSPRVKAIVLQDLAGEQYGSAFPGDACQRKQRSLAAVDQDHVGELLDWTAGHCPEVVSGSADVCEAPLDTSTAYGWGWYYTARAQAVRTAAPAWKLAAGETRIVRSVVDTTGSPRITGTTSKGRSVDENAIYANYYQHLAGDGSVTRRFMLIVNFGEDTTVDVAITRDGAPLAETPTVSQVSGHGADSNWNTLNQYVAAPSPCEGAFSAIHVPPTSVTLVSW
jgi:hypothetical protein